MLGDPRQTIYTFAGARSDFLTDFSNRYESAQVFELNRNYRSSQEIVDLANRVSPESPIAAVRKVSSKPSFQAFKTASQEASEVVSSIATLIGDGSRKGQIAVLSRTNSQLVPVETALKQAGIDFQVRGAGRFFKRPEVVQGIGAIRALQTSG